MNEIQQMMEQYAALKSENDSLRRQIEILKIIAKQNRTTVDTVARIVFAGLPVQFRNYSDEKQVEGFATDADQVSAEFNLGTSGPFFLKKIAFYQYRDVTSPLTVWLPNAGVHNDGNGTQYAGINFRWKLRSGDKMDMDAGMRSSAELKGPLHTYMEFPCEQELEVNRSLYVDILPLSAAIGGNTYTMYVNISGVMVVEGSEINKSFRKQLAAA